MPAEKNFIGNDMDSLVKKLTTTQKGIELAWDVVEVIQQENEAIQSQLFRYAEDIQTLFAERDMADMNEKDKNAAYKQLERFNHDFNFLMEQKDKSYKALESSHLDSLRRLAAAAEYKDDDTGVHIVRMSRFSALIARAYGKDETYCSLLEQASPMHDIGKIGIPDNVLKKPGKLTGIGKIKRHFS
jgi:response regulator RpfG family c-di-GMP phosphodiesterase